MKLHNIPQSLTIAFLALLFVAGSFQLFQAQEKYGWKYEETITIQGVSETQTVDLSMEAISLLFILWLVFLLLPKRPSPTRVFGSP